MNAACGRVVRRRSRRTKRSLSVWACIGCVLWSTGSELIAPESAQAEPRKSSRERSVERMRAKERRAARKRARASQHPEPSDEPASEREDEEEQPFEEEVESEPASASTEGAIADPELAGLPPPATDPGGGDGQTIEDPELAGSTSSSSGGSFGQENTGSARLVLRSRFAADLFHADPREEVWENVTIAVLDATLRRSEDLRFVIGVRARYRWSALAHDVPDAKSNRFELDAAPTAGYVDYRVGSGVHLQAGYQPLHLGRFDLLSATNVLAVNDLREGVAVFPEVTEIGQLSARLDWDVSDWFSLRFLYVPFFTPHIISVVESDYALFRMNQASTQAPLDQLGLTGAFAANVSRSDRARLADSTLAAFAPEPTFRDQQAAIRATMHGTAGELGFTAVTALEHLPSFNTSPALINATLNPNDQVAQDELARTARPVTFDYNRFAVFSMDGAVDIEPLSIGFEVAYMLHRTLYAIGDGPFPLDLPLPDTTDLAHAGLRVEYASGTEWIFVLESFFSYALSTPKDKQRSWLFLDDGRYAAGAGAVLAWNSEFGLGIELGAFGVTGPSVFFMPRIHYGITETFDLEVGAIIVEGRTPPATITPQLAIGGLYDTVDCAFVGVRYSP
jgi:hypothetical protein